MRSAVRHSWFMSPRRNALIGPTVYQAPKTGSSLLGCYTDGEDRTLTGPMTTSNSMTPASCVGWCKDQGYSYAGLEYTYQVGSPPCSMT